MNVISLDGRWKLTWSDGPRTMGHAVGDEVDEHGFLEASVPGEIHRDLERAGLLEPPELGLNALAGRWVEECRFFYRRTFELDPGSVASERAWLVFDRLDLHATVYVNGEPVGTHANAFRRCRIDVAGRLRPGRNVVAVDIHSGLLAVGDLPSEPYVIVPSTDARLSKRHWLRKPQYQFGWDWSTRLVNVGISGSVRLELAAGDDEVRVDDVAVVAHLGEDLRSGVVRVSAHVEGLVADPVSATLSVRVAELGVSETVPVTVGAGLSRHTAEVQVEAPELWWPRGHGAQRLYDVDIEVVVHGQVVATERRRVGFRRAVVAQDPHPEGGRYFRIEVNGRPVFAKGGNWVPPDLVPSLVDNARYDALIDRAVEANFNFLRVWGGGDYERDHFYDRCDREGILVWQEMTFACSWYPGDDEGFVAECVAEATEQVRRLASHPSLVVWCGNNEVEWTTWMLTEARLDEAPDHRLYHEVLAGIVADEDGTRFYVPSSPFSPDGEPPFSDTSGDQHPWSVGFANPDFRDYRSMVCRFPDEGGVLGPPSLPTLESALPEAQRYVGSPAWVAHDNSIALLTEMPGFDADVPRRSPRHPLADDFLFFWTGLDPRELSLSEFVYRAGLLQGEALREYCERFRSRMFESAASVLWGFNDAWPTTRGWAIVDYYLRRTPAFHAVRRALQPVHVVVAATDGDVVVHGVNDTTDPVEGTLRYGVFGLKGGYPVDLGDEVTLEPNSATVLGRFPRSEWTDPTGSLAFAVLERDGELVARNRLVLPVFHELAWASSDLTVTCADGQAVFESETFVWGVCLDLDGEVPLADNFFDVYPGIPHAIAWDAATPPKVLHIGNL
ncbi:MAG TPA: hypothetical protein VM938_05485 [Acidimicrobiales bacterium]|nr:hypothetical protein [Acidimicrobiales bacterium]